jgi:hypothetical protein
MAWCSAVYESKPRLLSDGPTGARGSFVAVDSGVSSRTSVCTPTGTAHRGSSTTRETVGGGTNVRQRSSGQGSIGASSSPQG